MVPSKIRLPDHALYVASYEGDWYPVMILPTSGDLSAAGMEGTLKDTPLFETLPGCYSTTGDRITWAEGYEDGGNRVAERSYPIRWFDGHEQCFVDWRLAKALYPFEGHTPPPHMMLHFKQAKHQRFYGMIRWDGARRAQNHSPEPTSLARSPSPPASWPPTPLPRPRPVLSPLQRARRRFHRRLPKPTASRNNRAHFTALYQSSQDRSCRTRLPLNRYKYRPWPIRRLNAPNATPRK